MNWSINKTVSFGQVGVRHCIPHKKAIDCTYTLSSSHNEIHRCGSYATEAIYFKTFYWKPLHELESCNRKPLRQTTWMQQNNSQFGSHHHRWCDIDQLPVISRHWSHVFAATVFITCLILGLNSSCWGPTKK